MFKYVDIVNNRRKDKDTSTWVWRQKMKLETKPPPQKWRKKKKRLYDVNKVQEHKRKYLQTLSRAPQVGSWWRWGPRCRPCDPHTLWPAGTPLWTWSLWNWTQSDGNIKPMLTRTRKSQIIPDVSLTGFLHTSPSQTPPNIPRSIMSLEVTEGSYIKICKKCL